MHGNTRNKFLKLKEEGNLTREELHKMMLEAEIDEEEVEPFLDEIYPEGEDNAQNLKGPTPPSAGTTASTSPQAPPNPNDANPSTVTGKAPEVNASLFEYDRKDLVGDSFKKYEDNVAKLPFFDMLDFEEYKVKPEMKQRFEGMPNSPWDLIGITVTNDTPMKKTRIHVKDAIEFNSQVRNTNRYLLLKQ